MKVRLSARAERDLERIGDRIADDDPLRAISFVGEIREACLGLADFPSRFPLVPGYEQRGIRHRRHGSYLIFYCVDEHEVGVVRILHGAMDHAALLSPD